MGINRGSSKGTAAAAALGSVRSLCAQQQQSRYFTTTTAVAQVGDTAVLSLGSPSSPPSVCVIGAGAAGLAAGRVLRDEGLRVTIFDKELDGMGGVWRYRPESEAESEARQTKAPMCESVYT